MVARIRLLLSPSIKKSEEIAGPAKMPRVALFLGLSGAGRSFGHLLIGSDPIPVGKVTLILGSEGALRMLVHAENVLNVGVVGAVHLVPALELSMR